MSETENAILAQVLAQVREMSEKFDVRGDLITRRFDEGQKIMESIEREVRRLGAGFPNDDPDGHRRCHEQRKEEALAKKELVRAVQKGVVTTVVVMALGGLLGGMWFAVKHGWEPQSAQAAR